MAPAWNLSPELRETLQQDSLRLMQSAKYLNAGTVEFLVDRQGRHYFIEVRCCLPKSRECGTASMHNMHSAQIRIAGGASLEEVGCSLSKPMSTQVGLVQDKIHARGVALQCRVTTENPERNFAPDTGTLSVYRHSAGFGMRMDGIGYSGMTISPYYDSLLVKVGDSCICLCYSLTRVSSFVLRRWTQYTARGSNFEEVVRRMRRALQEARIRGVKTNIPFLLNVLTHPQAESRN
eukprot:6809152-Prymnesium_polylepis.1